jgi:hypothetical protein
LVGSAEQTIKKNRKHQKHADRKACRKRLTNNLSKDKIDDIIINYNPYYNLFDRNPSNTISQMPVKSSQYKRYIRSRLSSKQKYYISLNRDNKYILSS